MIRASSIRTFWNARSRLEKAVAVLIPTVLLLEALGGPPGLNLLEFVTVLAGLALAVRYLRTALVALMWRLRHRLLITYLFIGVVPVLLVVGMAGIAAYIFYGQVATYMAAAAMEQMERDLAMAVRGVAADLPAGRAADLEEMFRRHLPSHLAEIRPEVRLLGPDEMPAWLKGDFQGLARTAQGYDLRAVVRTGSQHLLVSIDLRQALSAWLPGTIGTTRFLGLAQPRPAGPSQRGGPSRIELAGNQYEMTAVASGPPLAPPAHWADLAVSWIFTVPVTDWENGSTGSPGVLVVNTRPSLLHLRLFSTLGELSRLPLTLLATVAIAFLMIEMLSLLIGVRLTRSITRAVADLYEGTERIHSRDFSWRIPVRSRDQLATLAESFNTMTASLEQLIQEQKEKQRMQSELEIAREVQAQFFPKEVPSLGGLDLAGLCQPARTVSGDYYDFLTLGDRRLALAIGDIAGKGISAALLMASIQSMLHAQLYLAGASFQARAASAGGQATRGGDFTIAALVASINRQLHEHIAPGHFATFCCAVYDDASGELAYTNAGHLPPIILRDGQIRRLEKGGTVLGLFPAARYEQESLCLERGDVLVAFTDGVTEPENSYGEEFGEARLLEILRRAAGRSPAEIINTVMTAVREWTGTPELQDDMTLLVARRR